MKRIADQADHAALVKGDHDDRARQDFAFSYRNHITARLMPATRRLFDARAGKIWAKANGRPPQSPKDIRAAMDADPWYRFYLSTRRTSQDMIWASVIAAVETADPPAPVQPAGGTLRLDPSVHAPAYVGAIDIHCMPGGYLADRGDGDVAAGRLYDRGVYLYLSGLSGPLNDLVAQMAAGWLKTKRPDFAPAAILDMGCAVGHSTLAFATAFPDAGTTGIDVGGALLRYAHVRAESLGVKADFVQANAEATGFPDASFDLVISSIVLHETSNRGLPAILSECHRLLKPGGIMLHVDQPRFEDDDPWATFLQENETFYNNEPFWRRYRSLDLEALAREAGFPDVTSDNLSADVLRQSQNNAPNDPKAKSRGFLALMATKA